MIAFSPFVHQVAKKIMAFKIAVRPCVSPWLSRNVLTPAVLAMAGIITYWPSLHYEFQFDDRPNILKLYSIRYDSFFSLFFENTRWLANWLNSINYQISGFDPFGYRCINVALHIATTLMVYYTFSILLAGLRKKNFFSINAYFLATTTALLFLLHPVQTQTVSYIIQGRLEGLATFFVFLLMLIFIFYTQAQQTVHKNALLAALTCVAFFACGSKEIAIVSPLLILLVDWFFIAQADAIAFKKRLAVHAGLFFLMLLCYMILLKPRFFWDIITFNRPASNNIGNSITQNPTDAIQAWPFFMTQFGVMLHYIAIFLWPFNLSMDYEWQLVDSFWSSECIVPFALLMVLVLVTIYLLRKNRTSLVACAVLWFFIVTLPRCSIIPSSELLGDYKTYLASIGILFLLAVCMVKLITYYRLNGIYCLSILALMLSGMTYQRNKVWESSTAFWQDILYNAPNKARAYNNYGYALTMQEKYQEAIPYFKKAIKLNAAHYYEPYNNLAAAYSTLGKTDKAIAILLQGIKIYPYFPDSYNNLGMLFWAKKDIPRAKKAFEVALSLNPRYGRALFNMARVYLDQHDLESAWSYFKQSCTQADFDHESAAFAQYGSTSMQLHKFDEAIFAYTKALELEPGNAKIALQLGNAYLRNKNYQAAVQVYLTIIAQHQSDINARWMLSEAYLLMGQPDAALRTCIELKKLKNVVEVDLRMADCFIALGNTRQAGQILDAVLARTDVTDEVKKVVMARMH